MEGNNTISLTVGNWVYNAGLIGLYNILKNFYKPCEFYELVKAESHHMIVDERVFYNFSDKYFKYFIDNFTLFTPYGKIISTLDKLLILNREFPNLKEQDLDELNLIIKYAKEKLLRKSFLSGYKIVNDSSFDILSILKNLTIIKLSKSNSIEIKDKIKTLIDIINYLKKENVKKVLLSKEFTYNFTSDFLSNIAIWGKNNSDKNAFDVYDDYFVEPLEKYSKLQKDKFPFLCISCKNPLKNEFQTDLTWINAIGADTMKKITHYYKFNSDVSICPICNLIYSCIPAGFTALNGKGFFINSNYNFENLTFFNSNPQSYLNNNDKINLQEFELNSYFKLFDTSKGYDKKKIVIGNTQVVKIDSINKKRLFTFNILNKNIEDLIQKSKEHMDNIISSYIKLKDKEYFSIYEDVMKKIFRGENLYGAINFCIKNAIQGRTKICNADEIMEIQKEVIVNENERYDENMHQKINDCKNYGINLKEAYEIIKKGSKIDLLTYKLLNALKAKNINRFIDTVINAYIIIGDNVPDEFSEVIDDHMKFQALGYAFVLGLQSERNKKRI